MAKPKQAPKPTPEAGSQKATAGAATAAKTTKAKEVKSEAKNESLTITVDRQEFVRTRDAVCDSSFSSSAKCRAQCKLALAVVALCTARRVASFECDAMRCAALRCANMDAT